MRFQLRQQNYDLHQEVRTSSGSHLKRLRLFLRIEDAGFQGFGEINVGPQALNGDPGAEEVLTELVDVTLPMFVRECQRNNEMVDWRRAARFAGSRPASNSATALVEMALLDLWLQNESLPIASIWPESFEPRVQSMLSVLGEMHPPTNPADRYRVKVDANPLTNEQLALLKLLNSPIILDFNCGGQSVSSVTNLVNQMSSEIRIEAVEQPFAPGNFVDHAKLREVLDCEVSLDEGIRSYRDIELASRYGAAGVVCVKPSRVGGLANARMMIGKATELGMRPYVGGFFESRFARSVNAALARTSTNEPSDVALVEESQDYQEGNFEKITNGFALRPKVEFFDELRPIAVFEV